MKTGELEPNLPNLSRDYGLSFVGDLIASKTQEKIAPADLDWSFHRKQLDALEEKLDVAFDESKLPETRDYESVNRFLIDLRMGGFVEIRVRTELAGNGIVQDYARG